MAPVVDGLAVLYGEQANFIVVDIDDSGNRSLMEALNYSPRIRPGIYILDPDGNVVEFWFGVVDGKIIQAVLVDAIWQFS